MELLTIAEFSGTGSLKVFRIKPSNEIMFEKGVENENIIITISKEEFNFILETKDDHLLFVERKRKLTRQGKCSTTNSDTYSNLRVKMKQITKDRFIKLYDHGNLYVYRNEKTKDYLIEKENKKILILNQEFELILKLLNKE